MIAVDNTILNNIAYIDNQNRFWASHNDMSIDNYNNPLQLNAVFYKNILVWGQPGWARAKLDRFAFNSYSLYKRESILNMPQDGTCVLVSNNNNGFPIYLKPEPAWGEDQTPENMEYPSSTSYTFYMYDDIQSIYLNDNCQNMFRNMFSRMSYNEFDNIIPYLDFSYVTDAARMFEDCRYLGQYVIPGEEINNYHATANYLTSKVNTSSRGITNMYRMFYECSYLRGYAICPAFCTNFSYAYFNCGNLTGDIKVNSGVVDASYAFFNCYNLGNTNNIYMINSTIVTNLAYTFYRTRVNHNIYVVENTDGVPEIPDSVINMSHTFHNAFCGNTARSGNSVNDLSYAYALSTVQTIDGSWNNAKNLDHCFAQLQGAGQLYGDLWLNYKQINAQSEGVTADRILEGRSPNASQPRFNIHVKPGSFWNAWFWGHPSDVTGNILTWTHNIGGEFYFNSLYNLYIYYADIYKPGGVDLVKFSVNWNTGYNNMKSILINTDIDADINIDA